MHIKEIFDIGYKMSAVQRYSQTKLVNNESVLEHTGFVAITAYMIAGKLLEKGEPIDVGDCMCRAVCHDIDEIITGDIPRPTKYYNEGVAKIMHQIEDENMDKISNQLELGMIYSDWKNAKDDTREGFIISLCDTLAVVYKAYYESIMFGNKTIIGHASGCYETLSKRKAEVSSIFNNVELLETIICDAKKICIDIQSGE